MATNAELITNWREANPDTQITCDILDEILGLEGEGFNLIDLSGADLSGADLNDGNFTYADFSDANLQDTTFIEADLTGANFHLANLTNAVFFGASFSQDDEIFVIITGAFYYPIIFYQTPHGSRINIGTCTYAISDLKNLCFDTWESEFWPQPIPERFWLGNDRQFKESLLRVIDLFRVAEQEKGRCGYFRKLRKHWAGKETN